MSLSLRALDRHRHRPPQFMDSAERPRTRNPQRTPHKDFAIAQQMDPPGVAVGGKTTGILCALQRSRQLISKVASINIKDCQCNVVDFLLETGPQPKPTKKSHTCHTTRIPQVPASGRQHKQRDETCRTLNDNFPHHQAKPNCPRGQKARHQNGAGCLATQNGADQASITLPPANQDDTSSWRKKTTKKNMSGEEENGISNGNSTRGKFCKSREKRTRSKNTDKRE